VRKTLNQNVYLKNILHNLLARIKNSSKAITQIAARDLINAFA
jgi:hypothetical protein